MTDFYQTFISDIFLVGNVNISDDLEHVDQGHHFHESLYLGNYITDFNHPFSNDATAADCKSITSADF